MTSKLSLTHQALFISLLASGCSGAIGPLNIDDLSDAGRSAAGPDAAPGQPPTTPTTADAGRQSGGGRDAGRQPGSGPDAAPSNPTVCSARSIPATVQAVLATRCLVCHGATPIAGVPSSLATYDDLNRPSHSDPAHTVAEVSRVRITSASANRMPPVPGDALSATELQTVTSWIDAGMPVADCTTTPADAGTTPVTPPAPDPFAVAPRCTSGAMWTSGTKGSGQMQPGEACIACHSKGEGPRFAFGGTVYPSGHEPSQCDGIDGNRTAVQVVVSDATGRSITAVPNAAGNFYSTGRQTLTPPLRAKVVYMGRERVMIMAVATGDCNSCHSQNGAMGTGTLKAPGRVLLP